ncbi:MAG TPA: transcription-repair coupling factor [Bacteroidales bacterium]|nr:MAG: Transcription-repair-coupling factor [Bacteroidetes bacterium ADurb.Bin012]HNQ60160.1 transcription-repair coupling factor [Bacteroidales bacterium]HNU21685.1 transcription-repair coupling factor [Bacteroidales bacterium]HNV17292.1 transcription-repair coupling factor [Bacteroidales bacterium]HNZ79199.1 transcription-repair coupling factor [Bacteroidales bacterium]
MRIPEVVDLYLNHPGVEAICSHLKDSDLPRIHLSGAKGSSLSLITAAIFKLTFQIHLLIAEDKERAAYLLNDIENLLGDRDKPFEKRRVLFFPTSWRKPYEIEQTDNANVLARAEALNKIMTWGRNLIIVSYPEALAEKVVTKKSLKKNTFTIHAGEAVSLDFFTDMLIEYGFERVDFVVEPGQFATRGGIVDVFTFSHEYPCRIEFDGDITESIRTFDPASQLSIQKISRIDLLPNTEELMLSEKRENLLEYIPQNAMIWIENLEFTSDIIEREFNKVSEIYISLKGPLAHRAPEDLYTVPDEFTASLLKHPLIFTGLNALPGSKPVAFNTISQSNFNKNFELLLSDLRIYDQQNYSLFIFSDNSRQLERIRQIIGDLSYSQKLPPVIFQGVNYSLHEGFIDHQIRVVCYTDHQIFDRYHRYRLREGFAGKEALTLKELNNLKPGDYVTHIDHGIGRFDGLEIIENNGHKQEVIRIFYQNNDILYVSIHSLHRIAKYTGRDGTPPTLSRLGSNAWNNLKQRTKQKVKDIARDLIVLYAKRKASAGFEFSPDTYLQNELEASFIYEDTPDQYKATVDIKVDMEKSIPMDRLICGDVGFGKTEVAIRASFKAVADSKQVAVLVPTTILALQHYRTFNERLKDFPCRVEYLNRFKSNTEQKKLLAELEKGRIDIIIGTHRILSKDVKFKDLGLVIIDEEQKFGVAAKEKLKALRINIDTLTLTATPIPRTLQFSLLGARDLSVINTPPPNRQPVQTEIRSFSEETIRDAIYYELRRGGQVFFVHNRIQNIMEVAGMLSRFVPDARIAVAHGQMEGHKLEEIMLDFIEGDYDVLVSTTIIESGLDIPNVNTIIINDAQHFGLSELHQLRGRVGRSNKKAFCYLLAPPLASLSDDARRRLRAIEEFSDLGSGFNIAMRDLDIRGAGNLLGAEQSGFIADLGYETYQKILDEAMQELRKTEYSDLFPSEESNTYVNECTFETDLEMRIPVEYIGNITERLALYKELDGMENEDDLQEFALRLEDRFGPLPAPALDLLDSIRLRKMGKSLGMEKIVLKNGQMVCYFITDPNSPFYKSNDFTHVLQYIQTHQRICQLKENKNKLLLTIHHVDMVQKAIQILSEFHEKEKNEIREALK